ncbi:MAG TPA: class I SAM-dependent methyltransferase [Ideonella sp.]|jgi:hypothetical protein|nr:class I SAM-dependent methyltransferase [Ideonella sp.]
MTHGQDYYANYGGLDVADYVERHIRGSAAEMERMRRTVELVPPGVRTLLDVGAGHGVFLEELRAARGVAGVGIEITPAKVDYARSRGVDLRLGDAGALAFADGEFDAVVSCEVLEHLPFGVYEAALAEFARVAREWVIITVPFDEQRRFVRCPYCSARVNPDYHFRAFPEAAMQGLLPGFRLEQTLKLGWQRRSALVNLGRRLFERWPQFLVCPSCGYHHASSANAAVPSGASEGRARALARGAAAWLPARGKPTWLVGVFRKEAGRA